MQSALGSSGVAEATAPKSSSAQDLQHIQAKIQPGHKPSLLQTLAAFYYVWSFALGIYCWIFCIWLCTKLPLLWPALVAYTIYLYSNAGIAPTQDGSWPLRLRNLPLWRWLAAYFPARLHKTVDLPPDRPYIFCAHPHGIVSFSIWLSFATWALGFNRLFPGLDCRLLTLAINFRNPLLHAYLLWNGLCDVSKRSCLNLLRRGKSVAIAVGGGTESLYAAPGKHDLVLSRRKGFVKIALRTGASLVPVYCFGENNTFRTANELPSDSRIRKVQRRMTQLAGFTLPLYFGRGFFLPFGFLPFPVPLDVVVGEPIHVEKFEGSESSGEFDALVDKYHAQYVAALQKLFEDNRHKHAKGEADLRLAE